MTILNLFLLTVCIVIIVDLTGGIEGVLHPIVKRILHIPKNSQIKIPLIECSLCVSFHTGWIYLLCAGEFTIFNFMVVCLLAILTPEIKDLLLTIKDIINFILNKIHNLL